MPAEANEWMSGRAVCRELEIDAGSLRKVVQLAQIRVKQIPGLALRYCRADVLRVKAESVTTLDDRRSA